MGTSQVEQLFQIFSVLGTPTSDTWPGFNSTPHHSERTFPKWEHRPGAIGALVRTATSSDLDLLNRCLACCPANRASAAQLLAHPSISILSESVLANKSMEQKEELELEISAAQSADTAPLSASAGGREDVHGVYKGERGIRRIEMIIVLLLLLCSMI